MRALIAIAALSLAACASAPAREVELPPTTWTAQPVQTEPGAIYAAGQGLALFEDQKARSVGDTLTVLLVESTDAKTSSATSTSKSTSSEIKGPTILGRPVTVGGVPILNNSLGADHSFDGSGGSSQSNKLNGSVTVTVVQRLSNGNLAVRGSKNISLNQGKEFVRIEGIVRPADIAPDNTVLSSRVADARIAYGDNGVLGESNAKGWLARFFASEWMPF